MVAAGLEPVVVFWTGWGIHFMVLLSFTVQVTLLIASDFRRRTDWAVLKVVIWSAYMLADTAAIYALGHMSVLCNWSPEHQLMAVWAPLLLVHLGGQDNISAYAIEDNRLWLRHWQTFVLQVAAAVYVLYVSSILSHPMSSKVSWAAMLMFVVGVLKYGERMWALKCANSCASSSLSATTYDKVSVSRTAGDESNNLLATASSRWWNKEQIVAYSLLDVPKQMFEGPTSYVQISNKVDNSEVRHEARDMFRVVEVQLSMMYDLLYTKAAVVHTWYGLCSRVISLPFTIAALALFRSLLNHDKDATGYYYKRADVTITNVLLTGAVILEIMSVLRAIFSKWTAVLLLVKEWDTIGDMVFSVESYFTGLMEALVGSELYWSGCMRQHSLFRLAHYSDHSIGSKMAKRMGVEDWWDSNFYSWSTDLTELVIPKVLELVSSTTTEDITRSQGLNAVRRHVNNEQLAAWIWMEPELKLEERILVWHIATHVYIRWYDHQHRTSGMRNSDGEGGATIFELREAAKALSNYMFYLLAARPYMLPYPVSRQAYVQLCHDVVTHFGRAGNVCWYLLRAILNQKEALMKGNPLQIQPDQGIGRRQGNGEGETGAAATQPQPQRRSMNTTLDGACQFAAKLIHITAKRKEEPMHGEDTITPQETETFSEKVILNMLLEVWVEMLCYTAYLCNEKSHAKHLTDGGEIMTIIALLMIYAKNGLIRGNTSITSGGTAVGPSSSQGVGGTA